MKDKTYRVQYEEPGTQFIEPDSEEIMNNSGVDVKAGKLVSGKWVSWVPYYEQSHRDSPKAIRAIAENKHVAAGAVKEYYYG